MTTPDSLIENFPKKRPGLGVIILVGVIFFASLAQLFMTGFVIPRLSEIFQDMNRSESLPVLTTFVLHYTWVFVVFDCASSVAAIVIVRQGTPLHYLFALMALLIVQLGFCIVALFMPLVGTIIQNLN
jgi:type II secretory pathway component PulF